MAGRRPGRTSGSCPSPELDPQAFSGRYDSRFLLAPTPSGGPLQDTPLSSEIAGRYTIERELGRGATAFVYLARDKTADSLVALKVLRPELAESMSAERFLREIHVTQQLSHPRIAPVLDSGVSGSVYYCVLPYMDGDTLRTRLERERQLQMHDVLAIADSIGSALDYAHAHKVIHRDVKPENILFRDGAACLADFGIARALEDAGGMTTSTGMVRGTPAYMSPEQASGERDYDGRSDLYSLACVLYEAIAGMPAFVGPNAQAVLAQRLVHVPRSVRVYRPAVTRDVDAVLSRALAISPADRYQTAAEFTAALRTAVESPTGEVRSAARRRWAIAAAVAGIAVVALAVGPLREKVPWASAVALDTTRLAVFPVQAGSAAADQLVRGLQRWRGVTLTDRLVVDEQLRRLAQPVSTEAAASLAKRLGAGRYILVRVDSTATGQTAYGALYDVGQGQLYQAQLPLGSNANAAPRVYSALADSLLLRGANDDGPELATRSLPGSQLMIAARRALDDWDLSRADTLFARAAAFDTVSGRPSLWLAQERDWAGKPTSAWLPLAQVAAGRRATLSPRERLMVSGLVALGSKAFAAACAVYDSLVLENPGGFAGWYGIGECHDKNRTVVADPRSKWGWSFAGSYQRALDGYVTAFKLDPSAYRAFQENSYERLRWLLFVSSRHLRVGQSNPSGTTFMASPLVDHDTIVFVPVVTRNQFAGQLSVPLEQIGAAVRVFRKAFHSVTAAWALAAPASAGAKEAIAVSLELQGDPEAIDSLAVAQRLASDPLQRLRLAATRAYVQLKFGLPGTARAFDSTGLVKARTLADSILTAPHGKSPDEAALLAPLAALTGRCGQVVEYLRIAAVPMPGPVEIPRYLVADESDLLAFVTVGCPVSPSATTVEGLARRLEIVAGADSTTRVLQYNLLSRIVRAQFPLDSLWVDRLASSSDFLLTAERDLLRRRRDLARRSLALVTRNRAGIMPGELTPDAVLPEARLWLELGDSTMALAAISSSLDYGRDYPPIDWSDATQNVGTLGSLVQAMAMRADMLGTDRAGGGRRWATAVAVLWAGAAPELQPLVRRMRLFGSR